MSCRRPLDQEAAPYIQRGRSLLEARLPTAASQYQARIQWLDHYPVHEAWMRNDIPEVIRELKERKTRLGSLPAPARNAAAEAAGRLFLAIGRLQDAQETFEMISIRGWREGALLDVAILRGNGPEIDEMLRRRASVPHAAPSTTAVYLARRGFTAEARSTIRRLEESEPAVDRAQIEPFVHVAKGELALAEGRVDEAVALLESPVRALRPAGLQIYFLASQSLARAWMEKGDAARAQAVLHEAFQQRGRSFGPAQVSWLAVGFDLLRLHREAGQTAEAEAVRRELAAVLAFADADHPLRAHLLTEDAR
ncbi:MAG TPA: hypothetical protein VMT00_04670 [Thermoanaerobaculia bacterium]|nr:hypothetical protein [Thermoanaerobaculia bacterium]